MGSQAQQIGLADTCGGLKAAIAIAIDKAALGEDYRIVERLDDVYGLAAILKSLNVKARSLVRSFSDMGRMQEELTKVEQFVGENGIYTYCPYAYTSVR
jgi:protease-4